MTHFFWLNKTNSVKVDVVGLAFFLPCPERFVHDYCSCTSSIPSVLRADPVADHPKVEVVSIGFGAAVPHYLAWRIFVRNYNMLQRSFDFSTSFHPFLIST